jgi:hypothetical protein
MAVTNAQGQATLNVLVPFFSGEYSVFAEAVGLNVSATVYLETRPNGTLVSYFVPGVPGTGYYALFQGAVHFAAQPFVLAYAEDLRDLVGGQRKDA